MPHYLTSDGRLVLAKIRNIISDNRLEISLEYGVQFRRIIHMCNYFRFINQKLPEFRNSSLLIEICKVPRVLDGMNLRRKINKYSCQIFNLLLKSGQMVNFVDDDQRTAIYYLLLNYDGSKTRKKMITQLIEEGSANLEHTDCESFTPLLYVCHSIGKLVNGNYEITRNKYYPIHKLVNLLLQYKIVKECQKELRMCLHYLKTNILTKAKYIRQATDQIHLALDKII